MTRNLIKQLTLWHRRLCHPSAERLKWTIQRTSGIDLELNLIVQLPCLACNQAKSLKIPSTEAQKRAEYAREIIWCDLGSIKPVSILNKGFFSLITDDRSRRRTFTAHKSKDEVQQALTSYVNLTLAQLKALPSRTDGSRPRLKTVRIDGGREFSLEAFTKLCQAEGVEVVMSSPHNQYQNAVAERGIRFLQDEARAVTI